MQLPAWSRNLIWRCGTGMFRTKSVEGDHQPRRLDPAGWGFILHGVAVAEAGVAEDGEHRRQALPDRGGNRGIQRPGKSGRICPGAGNAPTRGGLRVIPSLTSQAADQPASHDDFPLPRVRSGLLKTETMIERTNRDV